VLNIRISIGVLAVVLATGACSTSTTDPSDYVDVPGLGATRVDVPRPSSADDHACASAFPTDESIATRVAALRRAGLFADRADLTDPALATEVEAAIADEWGGQIAADDPLIEMLVAAEDTTRVWWQDLEADVAKGNDVYRSLLEEWGRISVGAFEPTAIEETWASDTGPVTVSFDLDGEAQSLQPEVIEDWIDPRIATPINDLIASSGRRFEFVKAFDQTAFVLALTPAEQGALESRGWCFE